MKENQEKKLEFFVINIKLQSHRRKGQDAYIEIFNEIFRNKKLIAVTGGRHIILRCKFTKEIEGKQIFYGSITKCVN